MSANRTVWDRDKIIAVKKFVQGNKAAEFYGVKRNGEKYKTARPVSWLMEKHPKWTFSVSGTKLLLDDGQLLLSDSDSAWAIDLSSVALLLHSSTGFEITLEDSWSLDVTYTAWKGAEPLGRAIRERVPADRVVHVESRLGLPVSP